MPDLNELKQVRQQAELLHTAEQIEAALDQMAERISADIHAANPIVLAVMNGGLVPTGLLLPRLDFPLRLDYCHASRYGQYLTGHQIQWYRRPSLDLAGQTVLIIDDILDQGQTLQAVIDVCIQSGAEHVLSAVLCRKDRADNRSVSVDYIGLDIPDRYVFGYGLDYKGYWRNAPGLFALVEHR